MNIFEKNKQVKEEICNEEICNLDKGYNEEEAKEARKNFDEFHQHNDSFIQKGIREVYNKALDYSIESIGDLMFIIKDAHKEFDRNKISEEFVEYLLISFGVYFGDTLLRNGLKQKGYEWMVPEEIENGFLRIITDCANNKCPFLAGPSCTFITPVDRVIKYWDNGDIDDLYTFWRSIKLDLDNDKKKNSTQSAIKD